MVYMETFPIPWNNFLPQDENRARTSGKPSSRATARCSRPSSKRSDTLPCCLTPSGLDRLYPDSSLADHYDPTLMPKELLQAHRQNDRAVMAAYGFSVKMTESECMAELFKRYSEIAG